MAALEECRARRAEGDILCIPEDSLLLGVGQLPRHPYDHLAVLALTDRGASVASLLHRDRTIQTVVISKRALEHWIFPQEFGLEAGRVLREE